MNNCLITGAAGFIGFHFSLQMLKNDYHVIGIDNMNSYYDKRLKEKRIEEIEKFRLGKIPHGISLEVI